MNPQSAIAHYRVISKLGEGGMGAVYRATDTKLNREVAIKVLPDSFAADADRLARFTREAHVLASLNHPNIAAIYGVEERALVLELVEGPTLADRIANGPVPLDEALPIGRQIAEALEYAHEKSVIHRDLKPANIKVTPDGRVKVLDFGLAKALSPEVAAGNPTISPTLTMQATMAGVIMGTAAYMSPEQARGGVADRRSDVWSFGVVLYEMLTGRQSFAGETVSDTLASVLKSEPDWSALPPATPAGIRKLLRRCLERDRKRRLTDIGMARLEIDDALAGPAEAVLEAPAPPKSRALAWGALGAAVAAVAALTAVLYFRPAAAEGTVVRFAVALPEKVQLGVGGRLAISPDGQLLAFTAIGDDGQFRIWVRALNSFESRLLGGTEGVSGMFWSPDSRWIAFSSAGKLKKVGISASAASGPSQTICDAPSVVPLGAWSREGTILFGSPVSRGLQRVSQAGGESAVVTVLDQSRQETSHMSPQFLPDGRHFLYLALSSDPENHGIFVAALDGSVKKFLLRAGSQALYVPGHLLFLREGTLMAQPFDTAALALTGEAFPVAERVWSYLSYGVFSASQNGVLAYRTGALSNNERRLTWFDRGGNRLGEVGPPGFYSDLALSPDAKTVAVVQGEPASGSRNVWLIDLLRNVPARFTFQAHRDQMPVWSADGSRVFFGSNHPGLGDIYEGEVGGRQEEPLFTSDLPKAPLDVSGDGKFLLYAAVDPATKMDLGVLPLEGERKPRPYLKSVFNEVGGQFSPGRGGGPRWVAYSSDESGRFQIYIRPFDGGRPFQVSTAGGTQPKWRRDGRELFFANVGTLMAVDVQLLPKLELGVPKPLFAAGLFQGGPANTSRYSVSPDGKRFLINSSPPGDSGPTPINVVINWNAKR
jgi:Tol biopolymer transport system component